MKRLLYFSLTLLLAGACKQTSDTDAKHIVVTGIDSSKKPGDDFFTYVNGIWYDTAQIPASQTGVGSYSFLNFPQRIRMQGILDSVSQAKNPAGSIEQKVGDFYASGLDLVTINKRGYEPIKPILAHIDAIDDIPAFDQICGRTTKGGQCVYYWLSGGAGFQAQLNKHCESIANRNWVARTRLLFQDRFIHVGHSGSV
jgi:putative endopeptidase